MKFSEYPYRSFRYRKCHLEIPEMPLYCLDSVSLNRLCRQLLGFRVYARRQMGRRILNEALRAIVNAERRGKATVELKPISTVMSSFLKIMKDRGKSIATVPIWVSLLALYSASFHRPNSFPVNN